MRKVKFKNDENMWPSYMGKPISSGCQGAVNLKWREFIPQ